MVPESDERDRIVRVYESYAQSDRKRRAWSSGNRAATAIVGGLHQAIRQTLQSRSGPRLPSLTVLEIGCGEGVNLEVLRKLGVEASGLFGVDILQDRIKRGQDRYPEWNLQVADARSLPFPDSTFDYVLASVVFSSILDEAVAVKVAAEMSRVLKPGGAVLWYDLRYPNPFNRNVRPVKVHTLRRLFSGFELHLRSMTLVPPLFRALRGPLFSLHPWLARVPILRGHLFGTLEKPPEHEPSDPSR